MSIYDKSSLVLIPSGTKTGKVYSQKPVSGDGDFTFTRSSAATRVNADGNIEKETQNLLLQSNSFDTTWTNVNTTETGGQSDKDGGNTAWLLSKSAASARIEQSISQSGVQTFSVYAKAGSLNWIRLNIDTAWAYYDLANGVVGTDLNGIIDHNIYDVGSGWYRCELVVNLTATIARIYPAQNDGDVSGTSGNIVIQDAQLNQGLIAQEVITTTTTAVEGGITDNVPRLDYTDSSCPALLLEPQRLNSFPQSEYPSTSTLNLVNGGYTWTYNQINSPEGVQNASKWSAANNNAVVGVYQNFSATSGTSYTFSVFAKKGDHNFIQLQNGGGGSGANSYANFDLENGTKSDGATITDAFIDDFGNGWYRCGITFSVSSTTTSNCSIDIIDSLSAGRNSTFTGSVGDYFYLWGMQVEAGSYATSYIPTYGSSVTRVVDSCDGAGNSDVINSAEGVLFAEISALEDLGTARRYISLSDGSSNNDVRLYYNNTIGEIVALSKVGGATQFVMSDSGYDLTQTHKIAVKYKVNDFALWIDGVEVDTDSSGSVNAANTFNELAFNGNGLPFFGNAKQVAVFNEALSDSELATLTTI